jgi:hypothetical protein
MTRDVAITHDGRAVAFAVREPAFPPRLYLRRIGQLEATPIRGAEGAVGHSCHPTAGIGFLDGALTRIKKVSITGGPAGSSRRRHTDFRQRLVAERHHRFRNRRRGLKRVSEAVGRSLN